MSIARHTAYNVLGSVIPMILAIVTVPIYLKVIGLERYGILSIVWLVVGYFGMFDFGIGRAIAQRLAMLTDEAASERSHVFWIGAALSVALAVMAAALVYPAALLSLNLMKLVDNALRAEILAVLPLLGVIVAIGIVNSLLNGALEGRRKFLAVNAISVLGASGANLFPLAVALTYGPSLVNLISAAAATQVAALLLLAWQACRAVPIALPDRLSITEARRLLTFGGWISVSNLLAPLLTVSDRFALGRTIGAAAVAVYAIPMSIVQNIAVLPSAVSRSLFPRLAMGAVGQSGALRDQVLHATLFLLTPLALAAAIVMHPFLHLWLGSELAEKSFLIAMMLIPGCWMSGHARIPHTHLCARGDARKVALIHLSEVVPYFVALWLGLKFFGLLGAAGAWTGRATLDALLLHYRDTTPLASVHRVVAHGLLLVLAVLAVAAFPPVDPVGIAVSLASAALAAILILRDIPTAVAERAKIARDGLWWQISRR